MKNIKLYKEDVSNSLSATVTHILKITITDLLGLNFQEKYLFYWNSVLPRIGNN